MIRIFKSSKKEINLPFIVIITGILIGIYHVFSYLFPFTSHAFIVTNVTPIAADVSGFITKLYIRNGSVVKKEDPLFEVYQPPYYLAYLQNKAKYDAAIDFFHVIQRETQKTRSLLNAATFTYKKAQLEFQVKNAPSVKEGLSTLEVRKLNYDLQAVESQKDAFEKQIAIEDQQLIRQKKRIAALKAAMHNAYINLTLTTVRAPANGVIDNMYVGLGTPVQRHKPLFSFIDTATWWVQANFYETDLRHVKPGDKAYVMLRMYYFRKIFHGKVINTAWASSRQKTSLRNQQQEITSNNQWLLEPQRLPVQIEILDHDPKFPLHPGASAYVYIKTT